MKTRTKLLITLIVVLTIVAVGVVFSAVKKEMRTYHNQELVRLVYEYYEIENREITKTGEKATRLFLPEMISSDPDLFKGRRFYFYLRDFKKTGKYIDLLLNSEEGTVFNPFTVGYDVFKPPSDIILYEWCNLRSSYVDCDFLDFQYYDLKSKEEKKIRKKSEEILKIAEENFRSSLVCYGERKKQEWEFIRESQKFGLKLFQVNEMLDKQIKAIESSMKTFKGYYSFAVPSERFERLNCLFFYDPDPDFKLVRIEIIESSVQRCFDIGYERDYDKDCVWGYVNNKDASLDSFNFLSEILDLVEMKITEDPEIIKAALLAKSVE